MVKVKLFQFTENGLMDQIGMIWNRGFLNETQLQTIRESLCTDGNFQQNNVCEDLQMDR